MHPSVKQAFLPFSVRFESRVPFMYLDTQGHVTVGIGNKLESLAEAQDLPFYHKQSKQPATKAEIAAEYDYIKSRTDLMLTAKAGWAYEDVAQLNLDDAAIEAKFNHDLASHARDVVAKNVEFRDFETWPADAQLGLLSLAWAQGSVFKKWPKFRRACAYQNWYEAAQESHLDESKNRGSLRPRNIANAILFRNAAELTGDDSILYYPYVWDVGARPELRRGNEGYEVGAMQTLLLYHGASLITDGQFGSKTETVVKGFQQAKGIPASGIVDERTWRHLQQR